jgi:hypothetical protein
MTAFTEAEKQEVQRLKADLRNRLNRDSLLINWLGGLIEEDNGVSSAKVFDEVVIAGGGFHAIYHKNDTATVDVFLLNVNKRDAENFPTKFTKIPDHYTLLIPNVITALRPSVEATTGFSTNFVLTQYKTRQELIADFDYAHCCISYNPIIDKLYASPLAFRAMRDRNLVINCGKYLNSPRTTWLVNMGFRR